MAVLRTTAEVIDALGGVPSVRNLLQLKNYQQAQNWRLRGRFPGWTFLTLSRLVQAKGHTADPALWRMPSDICVADVMQPRAEARA